MQEICTVTITRFTQTPPTCLTSESFEHVGLNDDMHNNAIKSLNHLCKESPVSVTLFRLTLNQREASSHHPVADYLPVHTWCHKFSSQKCPGSLDKVVTQGCSYCCWVLLHDCTLYWFYKETEHLVIMQRRKSSVNDRRNELTFYLKGRQVKQRETWLLGNKQLRK